MKVSQFLFFLLLFQGIQESFAQPNWAAVQSKIEANRKQWEDEFSLTLASTDSVLLQKQGKTFSAKSQVEIGDISQWLTVALLLKLEEEGKLSLEDPVSKYIPSFEKYFKGYITLKQCLTLMTGIEDKSGLKGNNRNKFTSLEEEVNQIASRTIISKPGTAGCYGDVGIKIAGRVAEIATKKKFDILIRTKVLIPLGMRRTSFSNLNGGPIDPTNGALSTAEDLTRFLLMILNNGKTGSAIFLNEESINKMETAQLSPDKITNQPKSTQEYSYAMGAWCELKNKAAIFHSSNFTGGWVSVNRCTNRAFVLLTKEKVNDEKGNIPKELLSLIDLQLNSSCR